MVGDAYEQELMDVTLCREIELLADVMAAAAEVEGELTTAQLDEVLGLGRAESA